MNRLKSVTRRTFIGLMAMAALLLFPVATFAESPISGDEAGVEKNTGPVSPTGPDSDTYHFNEATGLWENDHYTWNPATKETKSKQTPGYAYNVGTGLWDTTEWRYDPPTGTYTPQTVSVDSAPGQLPAEESAGTPASNSSSGNNFSNGTQVTNTVASLAQSGDALVSGNTLGGNASTGDAHAIATVLNLLQSSWGMQGEDISTFMANIHGDVIGDLLIDPVLLTRGSLPVGTAESSNIEVKVATDTATVNNIDVRAGSGNAEVSNNTRAGGATTGAATALVNVLNLINSSIAAGKSFIGNINIHGNFEGDILLPDSIKSRLLASNVPRTTLDTTQIENGDILAEFTNSQAVSNNIQTNAVSGSATVTGNTSGGAAATGDASTNVTVFNLTGRQVVGSNALLVFVNVLGEWVGMIVDAPAGSTSAMLGDSSSGDVPLPASDISATGNSSINNNISAVANSGNALVGNNTAGGNATSGNANAGVNVMNLNNSQLSLADWFGVLFINVLGSWHGSFGIDTAMGDPDPAAPSPTKPSPNVQVFQFVPDATGTRLAAATSRKPLTSSTAVQTASAAPSEGQKDAAVLGSSSTNKPGGSSGNAATFSPWLVLGILALSIVFLIIERALRVRHAHRHLVRTRPQIIR